MENVISGKNQKKKKRLINMVILQKLVNILKDKILVGKTGHKVLLVKMVMPILYVDSMVNKDPLNF